MLPYQSGMMLGMSHVLQTGNPIIDMIVAMVLASLVGSLAINQRKWATWLQAVFNDFMSKEYTAYVVLEGTLECGNGGVTASNKIFTEGTRKIFEGIRAYLQKTDWESRRMYYRFQSSYKRVKSGDRLILLEPDGCERVPYQNEWITVPFEDSVLQIKYLFEDKSSANEEANSGKKSTANTGQDVYKVTFVETFIIRGKDAKLVNRFIASTTANTITATNDKYLSQRSTRSNYVARAVSKSYVRCDTFTLENRKSFDTLHFDKKEQILQTLDQFMAKEGVFAKSSRPYRLNILLHGPPGTGKTSLIKSIARHMDRSIVSINLSAIDSSTALQRLMLGGEFMTESGNVSMMAGLILVLEELDTYIDLLKERTAQKNTLHIPIENKEEKVDLSAMRDMVDIGAILECLDGTIDTPSRVLIMTTNHVEKLKEMDVAFLRPGRVDIALHLGYLTPQSCQSMLCQEFNEQLTSEQLEFFRTYVQENEVTPAMFESWCIQATSVDHLIKQLL